MSWVVEQSENTPAITVNGNTVSSNNEGCYGSPINVLYKDAANQNGQYYWIVEFIRLDSAEGGVSVGLTTDQGFQAGWGLEAMKYLGNLSDGSALLVSSFGERIKPTDNVGLLLELTDVDLKFYIFLNEQSLGLAFHLQAPYPKPLYPVVSFSCNGEVKITRSQQIPTVLNRNVTQFTGIQGNWKIVDNSENPETVGVQIDIKELEENIYSLCARVINNLNCTVRYDPNTQQWRVSPIASTRQGGPPALMQKERVVTKLILNITSLQAQGDQQLVIQTNNDQRIQLERFSDRPPSPVTQNIFN